MQLDLFKYEYVHLVFYWDNLLPELKLNIILFITN